MGAEGIATPHLKLEKIFQTWWPLAASWMLMGLELPILSAFVARLPQPEINLAAYGGVVFPIALIIESPIIMLLAASTALSRDRDSYVKLRRFTMRAGAILTALHLIIALTPLYYIVVEKIIGAPQEIVESARIGLIIMTPWTWTIAYRRFQQGILIRFGHSQAVGVGTMIRLGANLLVLIIGYLLGTIPGIIVATSAVATGVTSEAVYAGLRVRPVVRSQLNTAPAPDDPLTFNAFLGFYIPLVMTSFLTMIGQPIGSASLSRMPLALESLAAWPVVSGLVFFLRSAGVAYNEVVVALVDEQNALTNLRRFTLLLASITTLLLLLIVVTPVSVFWLESVSALSPALAQLARQSLWFFLPMPALSALQSWYQGVILNSRKTRSITEAIIIFLGFFITAMWLGIMRGNIAGLYVAGAAYSVGMLMQTIWLWLRSRGAIQAVKEQRSGHAALRADGEPIR